MDDNTRFPPMVDLSQRTELRWEPTGQQPSTIPVKGGKPVSTGWAKEYSAPPADLSPYPDNKEA
jgi:hypothetical protein